MLDTRAKMRQEPNAIYEIKKALFLIPNSLYFNNLPIKYFTYTCFQPSKKRKFQWFSPLISYHFLPQITT